MLESDADRERFGVKKRFTMRDGERFFAEGRENANFELLQQQMKRAGDWRLRLRYRVLRELAGLGRNPQIMQQQLQMMTNHGAYPMAGPFDISEAGALRLRGINTYPGETTISASGGSLFFDTSPQAGLYVTGQLASQSESIGGFGGGGGGGFRGGFTIDGELAGRAKDLGELGDSATDYSLDETGKIDLDGQRLDWDTNGALGGVNDLKKLPSQGKQELRDEPLDVGVTVVAASDVITINGILAGEYENTGESGQFGYAADVPISGLAPMGFPYAEESRRGYEFDSFGRSMYRPDYVTWLDTLFPGLASPAAKPTPQKDMEGWSAEAVALSKSLLRTEALLKLTGGVEVVRADNSFDPRWQRKTGHSSSLALYSPTAWLTRPLDPAGHTVVNYCDEKQRAVFSLALLLGRTRKSIDRDLKTPPLELADYSLSAIHQQYGNNSKAKVEPAGENQVKLTITFNNSTGERRLLIDTARHVVLNEETYSDGKLIGTTAYSDFVEVGGSWWARDVLGTNDKGQKTSEFKLDVKLMAPDAYAGRIKEELAAKPQVQFLQVPGVSLKTARQRVADGSAGFDDRITMILEACLLQQWDELFPQLEAAEKLAADKPGVRWVRTVILTAIRRNEEARKRLLEEAHKLAINQQQDDVFLTNFVLSQAQGICSPAEFYEFVQLVKPVYTRQPAELDLKTRLAGAPARML